MSIEFNPAITHPASLPILALQPAEIPTPTLQTSTSSMPPFGTIITSPPRLEVSSPLDITIPLPPPLPAAIPAPPPVTGAVPPPPPIGAIPAKAAPKILTGAEHLENEKALLRDLQEKRINGRTYFGDKDESHMMPLLKKYDSLCQTLPTLTLQQVTHVAQSHFKVIHNFINEIGIINLTKFREAIPTFLLEELYLLLFVFQEIHPDLAKHDHFKIASKQSEPVQLFLTDPNKTAWRSAFLQYPEELSSAIIAEMDRRAKDNITVKHEPRPYNPNQAKPAPVVDMVTQLKRQVEKKKRPDSAESKVPPPTLRRNAKFVPVVKPWAQLRPVAERRSQSVSPAAGDGKPGANPTTPAPS